MGGPHRGKVLFPTILNTYHPKASHSVPKFGNGSWSNLSREEGAEGPNIDAIALNIYDIVKF